MRSTTNKWRNSTRGALRLLRRTLGSAFAIVWSEPLVAQSELLGWSCLLLGQSHSIWTQGYCSQGCSFLGQSHSVWTQSCFSQGSLVRALLCWVRAARSELRGESYSVIPTQSELLGHQGQDAARSELLSAIDLKPPNSSYSVDENRSFNSTRQKRVADQVSGLSSLSFLRISQNWFFTYR